MLNLLTSLFLLSISIILIVLNQNIFAILLIFIVILLNIFEYIKSKNYNLNEKNNFYKTHKHKDFLTSLYNRAYYLGKMDNCIKDNTEFSIFNIDLNNFKSINDIYGHDVGDIVLKEVGKRFQSLEKKDIIFARFGGDEFAVLYKVTNSDKINKLGEEIKNVLNSPIIVSESEFLVSASIGVSRFPFDSKNKEDLLKLADMAMYHAKKSDKNNQYLISDTLSKKLSKRKKFENLLKNIDIKNDLFLEYQPIFDLKTKKLLGVEALVRWKNKTEGIIMPSDFIYIAEEMDIVKDITRRVFINGLKQIKEWNTKYNTNLKISLNVANSCIHNRIFFENLSLMLEKFEINPQWLAIELTETSLSVSPEYMKRLLSSINQLGVDIYLDDFGTNNIKIPDLKKFKIKMVKIDNTYISSLKNEENLKMLKAMILLAQGLDIKAHAEGVETEEQYKILEKYNCDTFQGFCESKAISNDEFEKKYLNKLS